MLKMNDAMIDGGFRRSDPRISESQSAPATRTQGARAFRRSVAPAAMRPPWPEGRGAASLVATADQDLGVVLDAPAELVDQAALADPWLTREEHDRSAALASAA